MASENENMPIRRTRARRKPRRRFPWRGAVMLLLAGGVLFCMARFLQDRDTGKPVQTSPEAESSGVDDGLRHLTLTAGGDVTLSDPLLVAGLQAGGAYDYTQALMNLNGLFAGADVAVADLEANFCGAPYSSQTGSAPEALAQGLAATGIDLVQAANTYSIYNGVQGLTDTLARIRGAGLTPLGAYSGADAAGSHVAVREINGIRVAFVAFTKGLGNLSLPEGSEGCVDLLYTDYSTTYSRIDTAGIQAVLAAAEKEKPDLTVAMVHWGSEYDGGISDSQEKIRSILLDGGVDVILGSHSHLPGKLVREQWNGRDTFTAYSLGNLFAAEEQQSAKTGLVLTLSFTKDLRSGEVTLNDARYTPVYMASAEESPIGKLQVLDIPAALALYETRYYQRVSKEVYEKLIAAMERLEEQTGMAPPALS